MTTRVGKRAGDKLAAGSVVGGRYRILAPIGQGGMGAVYLAEHLFIERHVAIKVLNAELAQEELHVMRFLTEARAAARGCHENIVKVYDFGETEDSVYLAMEYLEGETLAERLLREGPLSVPRALRIAEQLCRALHAAHEVGVVHLDLKPENIFLMEHSGRRDFVKLLDFGLARLQAPGVEPTPSLLTDLEALYRASPRLCGTPQYMAPEQISGEETDRRADIFALGCVLYEMLVGHAPLPADTTLGLVARKLLEDAEPPSRHARGFVPPTLEAACLRALARDRDLRFSTAHDMGEVLRHCAADVPQRSAVVAMPLRHRPSNRYGVAAASSNAAPAGLPTRVLLTSERAPRGEPTQLLQRTQLLAQGPQGEPTHKFAHSLQRLSA